MVGDSDSPNATPSDTGVETTFRDSLIGLIPFLRAFARTLSGNRNEADDLCQEALVKAWQSRASFQPGTNLKAWLFMILRNHFYSTRRRGWRQLPWDEKLAEQAWSSPSEQQGELRLQDLARAMHHLTDEQREALILVGAGGFSCEEASRICGCAVGTIKSRVARARQTLVRVLEGSDQTALAPRAAGSGEAFKEILGQLDELTAPARGRGTGA